MRMGSVICGDRAVTPQSQKTQLKTLQLCVGISRSRFYEDEAATAQMTEQTATVDFPFHHSVVLRTQLCSDSVFLSVSLAAVTEQRLSVLMTSIQQGPYLRVEKNRKAEKKGRTGERKGETEGGREGQRARKPSRAPGIQMTGF